MRNLPSSIEKDKLYRALVKEVVESKRDISKVNIITKCTVFSIRILNSSP